MFFTQEDYLKIQRWLQRNSVRDTEFQEASTPLRGNETVALVQSGQNRKIFISDLVDQIFTLGVTDFLNISELSKEYGITLDKAITLLPPKARKAGQVITFKNEKGNWEIYQFTGNSNQWAIIDLWEHVGEVKKDSITLNHLSQEVKDAINSGGGAGELLPESIDSTKLANGAVTTEKIGEGAVNTNNIADNTITFNKLESWLKNKIDIIPFSTDNLPEGTNRKYFTEERVINTINSMNQMKEFEVCPKTLPVLKDQASDKDSVFTRPSRYPDHLVIVYHDGIGLEKIISNPAFIAYSRMEYEMGASRSEYGTVQWWVVFPGSEEYNKYNNIDAPTSVQVRPDKFFISKSDGKLYRYNSVSKEFSPL